MKLPAPVIDYRKVRLNNLTSPEFRHLLLLIYWPLYLVSFMLLEQRTPVFTAYSPLDDLIPFCEWFFIPYSLWWFSLLGLSLYTLAYDLDAYKRFMYTLILTTVIAEICYIICPSQQLLRPDLATLGRSNPLTWLVGVIYFVDSNTNVCPSLHCIGAFAVYFCARSTPALRTKGWTIFFALFAASICASTVFIKQHSIIDFFAAIPVAALAYFLFYFRDRKLIAAKKFPVAQ